MGNTFESISQPDSNDFIFDPSEGTKVVFQGTQFSGKDLLFRNFKHILKEDTKFDKEFIKMMAYSSFCNTVLACYTKSVKDFPEISELDVKLIF